MKIQDDLNHRKGKQDIKDQEIRKFKPKDEVAKTGWSGLVFWMVRFSQNR
jgi:hypothetical protein